VWCVCGGLSPILSHPLWFDAAETTGRVNSTLVAALVLGAFVTPPPCAHAQTAAASCDLSTVANRINAACCPSGACAIGASHAKFGPCDSTYTTLVRQIGSLATQWRTCTARPTEQLRVAVALGCAAAGDDKGQTPPPAPPAPGGGHRRAQGDKSGVTHLNGAERNEARRRVQQHSEAQATNERILSDFALDCARQDAPGLPEGRQCMARGELLFNDDQATEAVCEGIFDNIECSQTPGCTFNYLWFRCEVDCGGTPDAQCDATEGCHLEPACVVDDPCAMSWDVGTPAGICPDGCTFDEMRYQCTSDAGPHCDSMMDTRTCVDTPGCRYNWNGYRCERDVSCVWVIFN
jgi:hypothetical protein